MAFKDLQLAEEYTTDSSQIIEDFFSPMYQESIKADMILGYFNTDIFELFPESFMNFAERGGKLRLVLSTEVTATDLETIHEGYILREKLEKALIDQTNHLLADEQGNAKMGLLVKAIAENVVEVKIGIRLFNDNAFIHVKNGVFYEDGPGIVRFKGSRNHTLSGFNEHQYNTTDVFCNWLEEDGRESKRVQLGIEEFQSFWSDSQTDTKVIDFPEAYQAYLEDKFKHIPDLKAAYTNFQAVMLKHIRNNYSKIPQPKINFREHQKEAKTAWIKNGYHGIFKHCTASGKTISAILCIKEWILLNPKSSFIIIVPGEELLNQWFEQIKAFLGDECDILSFSSKTNWRKQQVHLFTTPAAKPRISLVIHKTAVGNNFFNAVNQAQNGKGLMIIADEVHNLGAPSLQELFKLQAEAKLGLSATPERHLDPHGTELIMNFFNGIVSEFNLEDGIKAGFLSEYEFFPTFVSLSPEERENYLSLTQKIGKLSSQSRNSDFPSNDFRETLLYLRARVIKTAASKILQSRDIIKENYNEGDRWLVFCDDRDQLDNVIDEINAISYPRIHPMKYYAGMNSSRAATLTHLNEIGGIVVAIQCLDEGVDIPALDTGLILASSRNPRQYIQRRGRLLRKGGPPICRVFDLIVLPDITDMTEDDYDYKNMIKSELVRAHEFARTAINRIGAQAQLNAKALEIGFGNLTDQTDEHGSEETEDDNSA